MSIISSFFVSSAIAQTKKKLSQETLTLFQYYDFKDKNGSGVIEKRKGFFLFRIFKVSEGYKKQFDSDENDEISLSEAWSYFLINSSSTSDIEFIKNKIITEEDLVILKDALEYHSFVDISIREIGDVINSFGIVRVASFVSTIIQYKNGALNKTLNRLLKDNIVNKYGLDDIEKLIVETGKLRSTYSNFEILGALADEGIIEKYGIKPLIEIAKLTKYYARGADTHEAFKAFMEVAQDGVLEKYGIEPLIKIAEFTMGHNTGDAFKAFGKLALEDVVDKYGMEIVIKIAEYAKGSTNTGFKALKELSINGIVDKYGNQRIERLFFSLDEEFGSGSAWPAYSSLCVLAQQRIFDMYGIDKIENMLINIHKIAWHSEVYNAYNALSVLALKGIINKYGLEKIEALLTKIPRYMYNDIAYDVLAELAQKGILEKYGVDPLIIIGEKTIGTEFETNHTIHSTYRAFGELAESGVIDRYGLEPLTRIAEFATWNTHSAFQLFGALAVEGLVEKYGLEKILNLLLKIKQLPRATPYDRVTTMASNIVPADHIYLSLADLAHKGIIETYGIERTVEFLSKIAEFAGEYPDHVFMSFRDLVRNGIVGEYGIETLVRIAKFYWEKTGDAYGIFGAMAQARVVEQYGLKKTEEFLRKIPSLVSHDVDMVYHMLKEFAEKGVFLNYGFDPIVRIASFSGKYTFYAYLSLASLEKGGVIKTEGIEKILDLLRNIAGFSEDNTNDAYRVLSYLARGGMAYGMEDTKKLLFTIKKFTGKNVVYCYHQLECLARTGFLEKYGAEPFINISEIAGYYTYDAYIVLCILAREGSLKKYGIKKMQELFGRIAESGEISESYKALRLSPHQEIKKWFLGEK